MWCQHVDRHQIAAYLACTMATMTHYLAACAAVLLLAVLPVVHSRGNVQWCGMRRSGGGCYSHEKLYTIRSHLLNHLS